jgi:two-component system NtrC family sensor kinase
MLDTPVSLLIVDDEPELVRLLAGHGRLHGFAVQSVSSVPAALDAFGGAAFDVAVVDLALGSGTGLDAIRRIKARSPDTEIVVTSAATSLASAIKAYELAAFAVVEKPFDAEQLFATLQRALERRRMNLDNRRLVWELQTINEIVDGINRSLELDDVLEGALQRIVGALDAVAGTIRLRDQTTGALDVRAHVGPATLRQLWTDFGVTVPRPSDQVLASGKAVLLEDLAALVPPQLVPNLPVRSALAVPVMSGDELLGTLTVGSMQPFRFSIADQRLLATIAGQVGVAVENARLHEFVSRGKREWEQTFDAISDPIAVFDGRGLLLRGNAAFAARLGVAVTGMRHVTCDETGFCDGPSPGCAVSRALQHEGGRAEVTLANGQIYSVTTCPVAGGPDGASVVQVAKNVTEEIRSARRLRQMSEELAVANARLMAALDQLKSTQAQLLQAEKLSAIGQLVSGVAHELNNPLTSVIGYAQLLEAEFLDDSRAVASRTSAEVAQDLRRIAEESGRAARIVRNLLAFARRQTAARAPQDVAELCGRVLALRSYELRLNSVDLRADFASGLPPVIADGGQLQQALLNLVLNAEQAMRNRPQRVLSISAKYDDAAAAVELRIADTGHGIDEANLTRIFDPFFTTRDVGEGTGLGLSICYGIVRDHGGQITVESRAQVGTTFSLLLPARVEDPAAQDEILVAHAEQGDRDFVTAALTGWGHPARPVGAADQALARYARGGLQAMFIDRGLLAAELPAWRAARAAEGRPVPIILMSLAADETDVERFAREQASAVLVPPFDLRALRAAVRAVAKECV